MFPYEMYEAERTRSATEQREIDQINAEIVAAITGPFRSLAARLRSARRTTRTETSRPRTPSPGCDAAWRQATASTKRWPSITGGSRSH
jgi:hypothetical protein